MFAFNLVRWLKTWCHPCEDDRQKASLCACSLEELEPRLAPAFVWSGGGGAANDNWNFVGNWAGGLAPTTAAPADLSFDSTASFNISNDNIPGLVVNSITVASDPVSGAYSFTATPGDSMTLGNPAGTILLNTGATATIAIPTTLAGAATINLQTGASLAYSGAFTGTAAQQLTKQGAGTLTLSANNSTLLGPVLLDNSIGDGVVAITNANALGSGTTTISTSTQLQLNFPAGGAVINTPLILNGSGTIGNGALLDTSAPAVAETNTWAGSILMNSANGVSNTTFGVTSNKETLTITGQISNSSTSPYTTTKEGAGTLYFDPYAAAGNTYGGNTIVNAGLLDIGHPFALGAGGGTTTVNTNADDSGSLGLSYDPLNTFVPAADLENAQVQTVTLNGPTIGATMFQLSFNGATTPAITYGGAIGGMVQADLDALLTMSQVGANVAVTQAGSTFTVTFKGSLGGILVPTLGVAVTAGPGTVTIAAGTQRPIPRRRLPGSERIPHAQRLRRRRKSHRRLARMRGTVNDWPARSWPARCTVRLNNQAGDNAWEKTITFWSTAAELLAANQTGGAYYERAITIGAVADTNLTVDAVLQDNGLGLVAADRYSFAKVGNGRVILTAANTFNSDIDVLQGILNIRDSNALGLSTTLNQQRVVTFSPPSARCPLSSPPQHRGLVPGDTVYVNGVFGNFGLNGWVGAFGFSATTFSLSALSVPCPALWNLTTLNGESGPGPPSNCRPTASPIRPVWPGPIISTSRRSTRCC